MIPTSMRSLRESWLLWRDVTLAVSRHQNACPSWLSSCGRAKTYKQLSYVRRQSLLYNSSPCMKLPLDTGCKPTYRRNASTLPKSSRRAHIALGSNVGDRFAMIEAACRMMRERGISIVQTSALYETEPMYVEDQPRFLNGACEIETALDPQALLSCLKSIEDELGRIKTVQNGPRPIDLDILTYDNSIVSTPNLQIPHPRISEREFVLRPICDIAPHATPPGTSQTFSQQLQALNVRLTTDMSPLTLMSQQCSPISSLSPMKPTILMAVINLTPDSFSDGGLHNPTSPTTILAHLSSLLPNLAAMKVPLMIDLGGQSTRPNATSIPPDQELSRILPTLQALRSSPAFAKIPISIDTYNSSVASTTIKAGANIINDISAGQLDPQMLPTIASLNCSCILMHTRGTPTTMQSLAQYPPGALLTTIAAELKDRVQEALRAGIPRWRILLDPGIGFAKTSAHNLEILRDFYRLRTEFDGIKGFPWVVGSSRKKFIGQITQDDVVEDRRMGTAVCVDAAVRAGADVVRVHDVRDMARVVRMAEALWRNPSAPMNPPPLVPAHQR